jgi:CheY-like chemotaxis protein
VLAGAPAVAFEGTLTALQGWWWVASYPLFDEQHVQWGAVSVVRDVTTRRQAEDALRKVRDELEGRVIARTSELAASNDALVLKIAERRRAQVEAEQANRAKSEFLSRMSHELRTPLNAILGFGEVLKTERGEVERAENIDQILSAGHHLLALVDEVLDIAQAEEGVLALPGGSVAFGAAETAVDPRQRSRAAGQTAAAVRPSTVLYIEDNQSNLRLVERILVRRPEITLLHAAQGLLGLEVAREHRPDLILLDLHLPDIHGEHVLEQLVRDPRTAVIPVIVISADATTGQIKRLTAAGARAYLTKPLDVGTFLASVDGCLRPAGEPATP